MLGRFPSTGGVLRWLEAALLAVVTGGGAHSIVVIFLLSPIVIQAAVALPIDMGALSYASRSGPRDALIVEAAVAATGQAPDAALLADAGAAHGEGAAPAAHETVSYRIDPDHSRAMFEMKATLHTVEGKTSAVAGTITLPAAPTPQGFDVGGRVAIAARTLETGNGSRDKRMRSESLAVDRFPEIVFVPSRATGSVASFAPGTTARFKLEGSLTVRGVMKPVILDVTARFTEQGVIADGTTTFSFLDFGVPDPSNFFLHVKPALTIKVHVEGGAL